MDKVYKTFIFDNPNIKYWIKSVNSILSSLKPSPDSFEETIKIVINKNIGYQELKPVLIVLISCFIKSINNYNYIVNLIIEDVYLDSFIREDLQFNKYFKDNLDHVESKKNSILNLWHVKTDKTEAYSISVTNFFQRKYFKKNDLSILKVSLDEIFANIADHSRSEDNAYSYIHYDERSKKIYIAACDLGLGIPYTLKKSGYKQSYSDTDVLKDSLIIGVSSRSKAHNMGRGLDNIISGLSDDCEFRLVSNKSLLYFKENKENLKAYDLDFDFKGTLIYFELLVDSFPIEEFLDDNL